MSVVVFIDDRVNTPEVIISSLTTGTPSVLLNSQSDGLDQMLTALAQLQVEYGPTFRPDAIHIVSHGSPGAVYIGANPLNLDNLACQQNQWLAVGQFLADSGDILIYGCNVGQGVEGQALITELARITGADIAASIDLTGGTGSAGNTTLEAATGPIEAASLDLSGLTSVLANTAPVLIPVAPTLSPITEDDISNAGQTVASILGSSLSDADVNAAQGIALYGVTGDYGRWQFSLGAGTRWIDVPSYVSPSAALLLRNNDLLRWLPDGTHGTTAGLSYYGWDQSSGIAGNTGSATLNGGSSAFSTQADTATLMVSAANDAPVFGTYGDGRITTNFQGSTATFGYSHALQADGKILVVGSANVNGNTNFALARYNPDGSFDASFSDNGLLITDFGGSDVGLSVAVQSNGKIVAAGARNGAFAIARYNPDGTLDTSFSGDGKQVTSFGSTWSTGIRSIALQPDGKILVAGDVAVARYNMDGTIDSSFSSYGVLRANSGGLPSSFSSLALQLDGKILVAGSNTGGGPGIALMRLNADGSLDNSFSGDGLLTEGTPSGSPTVILQPDGKILVTGSSLFRYNSDGSLDDSFHCNSALNGNGISQQADGKILIAGRDWQFGQPASFALSRYNQDGSQDTSFSDDGMQTTNFVGKTDMGYGYGYSVTVQTDGKIVVAGEASGIGVVRYNSDGSLDASFGTFGVLDGRPIYSGIPVILDTDVQITDSDLQVSDYAGTSLTLTRHGGSNGQDAFSSTGTLGSLTEGDRITVSGIDIGSVIQNSAGTLILSFDINATQGLVNAAMREIAYANTSDTPPATVQIDWIFSDGNTGLQGTGGAMTASGSTIVDITPGKHVSLLAYSWKAHTLLDGVSVASGTHSASTGSAGDASFMAVTESTLPLSASRVIPSAETSLTSQAVNLQDAIAILKMIVGLPVNGANQPLSPYQAYAADFDGNGLVTLTDAIGILKHVVGLPASDPQWVFFNEADASVPGKTVNPTAPGAAPVLNADLSGNTASIRMGLVGVLRGDVDGSYAGGGTQSMDNLSAYATYFQSTDHGLNPAQFGIYSWAG